MAGFIADNVFDSGLNYLDTNGDRIDICYTQQPTTYTEATSTYTCGNKTSINPNAPSNDTSGRKCDVPDITDGSVTASQTAGWWAWSYVTGTELLAAQALSASQAVTSGNTFNLTGMKVNFQDPTA